MVKAKYVPAILRTASQAQESAASKRMKVAMIALIQTIIEAGGNVRRP